MNGAHDLGGMHGLEPIDRQEPEPALEGDGWERRVFALTLAMGARGEWNIDMTRFARERSHPAQYLGTSYYAHWLHGLELLLAERGHVTPAELEERMAKIAEDTR